MKNIATSLISSAVAVGFSLSVAGYAMADSSKKPENKGQEVKTEMMQKKEEMKAQHQEMMTEKEKVKAEKKEMKTEQEKVKAEKEKMKKEMKKEGDDE
ncbi:hypothetical protein [Emcibacter nanhaiensis]|uniref:Uncharacterized protein n=1 Tax=Emcibacter nanhaiensis TaxID=1505037 RepID=A0A501PC62_9PROT|nr:hypothetical protein [Emcibacter nanhaiensis]TPD57778.1 hypothetical protein FIV46_16885 [Emcibacter nanhaiensis]